MKAPKTFQRLAAISSLLAIASLGCTATLVADDAKPAKFMGTGTCASSNCHGGVSPRNSSSVLQNEFVTWQKRDKHATAYQVLLNSDSKIIARHMGIKAAEHEPLCLKCHSTYIPNKALHGERFNAEDGVTCESCHGAAEHWLQPHAQASATHENNLSLGLKDLASNAARAELCVSCHFGDEDKTVNHRLIGAGHPRLNFELDTFGTLQPKHWEVDEDYIKRKGAYEPARAWLVGQLVLAMKQLDKLVSHDRSRFGAMPELTLFNCYACHHDLTDDQWKQRSYGGHPGELRLNLSSLLIVRHAVSALNKGLGEELDGALRQVEDGFREGNKDAVKKAKALLDGRVRSVIAGAKFSKETLNSLVRVMLSFGANVPHLSYETAEQVAMAIASIVAQLSPDAPLYREDVNALFQSLGNADQFKPEQFTKAAAQFLKRL